MSGALETLRLRVPEAALATYEAALASVSRSVGLFRDETDGSWLLEAVRERGAGEAALTGALELAALVTGTRAELDREPVAADGWLARSLAGFPEQRIGRRFVVRGTHLPGSAPAGRIGLIVDAGMAFGSGEHGSTRACLRALDTMASLRGRRVLDLGTGTGILAIAAARLGAGLVVASDIDPVAVACARRNARLNQVHVRVGRSDGWRDRWVRALGPYDLVFANILARPLIGMAGGLAAHLAPGGRAILSGLLARHVPWVGGAHRAHGLIRERVVVEDGWAAIVVRRPAIGIQAAARVAAKLRSNTR